ncbi:MAG: hypothetical protein M1820_003849 [Bogoriella megaspora]|nr:MAG: hypothetical protein M1820_003849 [Bogoriella megaspora]
MATTEADVADAEQQLKQFEAQLEDDPENEAKKGLVETTKEYLAALYDDLEKSQGQVPLPVPPKATSSGKQQKAPETASGSAKPAYKLNDVIMAKWISGDKQFYQAKIIGVYGSSANPKYTVRFIDYDGYTEQVGIQDTYVVQSSSKKRKADTYATPIEPKKQKADVSPVAGPAATTAAATGPVASSSTGIISAAPNINKELASQVKKEPSKVSDGPARPAKVARKVKANKELESTKNNWKNFNAGLSKKGIKTKESMFRVPDNPNARVGFTGSGKAMSKDIVRTKHVYSMPKEEED